MAGSFFLERGEGGRACRHINNISYFAVVRRREMLLDEIVTYVKFCINYIMLYFHVNNSRNKNGVEISTRASQKGIKF